MTEQSPFSAEYPKLRQDGDDWVISVEAFPGDVTEVRTKDGELAKKFFDLTQLTFGAGGYVAQRKIRHALGVFLQSDPSWPNPV